MSVNVYQIVTDRIIEQLKQGNIPWRKPWFGVSSCAFNRVTKKPYSLLNQMLLKHKGEYATFKQWSELGGQIKKGAKSELVVFWKLLKVNEMDDQNETNEENKDRIIPMLRYYRVFHISDVEGVEPLEKEVEKEKDGFETIMTAQQLFDEYIYREQIDLNEEKGDESSYSPTYDRITLPLMDQFISAEEYYSVAFHEVVHSTGHEKRCNRCLNVNPFSKEYAKEELTAEIGAAFLLNLAGIKHEETETNNVAYIASWLKHLENDNKFIVSAAGKAEKAVEYICFGKNEEMKERIAA